MTHITARSDSKGDMRERSVNRKKLGNCVISMSQIFAKKFVSQSN